MNWDKVARFCRHHLHLLPHAYQEEAQSLPSLIYFAVGSLALLEPVSGKAQLSIAEKEELIAWFKSLYDRDQGGFHVSEEHAAGERTSLIQTYSSLAALRILGAQLDFIDKARMASYIRSRQLQDGSFRDACEARGDPRGTYAAFMTAALLDEWSGIDVKRALGFLDRCQSYDGAFAMGPGLEGMAGSTFCCLGAYTLATSLSSAESRAIPNIRALELWLTMRQVGADNAGGFQGGFQGGLQGGLQDGSQGEFQGGFQGRPHKALDACYGFWASGSLSMLGRGWNKSASMQFIEKCYHELLGGIAKAPGELPDIYHTFMGLSALSLSGKHGLRVVELPGVIPGEGVVGQDCT